MPAVGRRLAASSGPIAEAALFCLSLMSQTVLMSAGQLERHRSWGADMDSMQQAGLLAWPAAVLSAASVLLPVARPDSHEELLKPACGLIAVYLVASSRLGADAVGEAQAPLPAALRILLHAAGRLARSGERPWIWAAWAERLPIASALGASLRSGVAPPWTAPHSWAASANPTMCRPCLL